MSIRFFNKTGSNMSFPPDWNEIGYEDTPDEIVDGFNYAKSIMNTWDSNQTNLNDKFTYDYRLRFFPDVDTSNAISMTKMFSCCYSLISVPLLDTSNCQSMGGMFKGCYSLFTIPKFNTKNVTTVSQMFEDCHSLKSVPLIDTSKCTTMGNMFRSCEKLESVPIFNTEKAVNMSSMFTACGSLTDESLNNILAMCTNSALTKNKTLSNIGLNSDQATICQTLSNYQDFIDAGWTIGY